MEMPNNPADIRDVIYLFEKPVGPNSPKPRKSIIRPVTLSRRPAARRQSGALYALHLLRVPCDAMTSKHLSAKACRVLALLHLSRTTSSFCVLPALPGTRPPAASYRRPTAPAFESVFIEPPSVRRPSRDPASSRATHVAISSSMGTSSEVRASSRWEGFWSGGLDKGDMWDTGVVSPALQKLLDEGSTERRCC